MQRFIINEKQVGKRIERVLRDSFPSMPASAMFKAFRKKDIKVNGQRVKEDFVVDLGDNVEVYIIDDILFPSVKEDEGKLNVGFTVVYEDKNILLVNKKQGIPVHPDREQSKDTLIDLVKEYLQGKNEYFREESPSLCHRLDRNTGGLVLIAKNNATLDIMLQKIKDKEIKKFYQCLVQGEMKPESRELKSYLFKDEKKSRVYINDSKFPGSVQIITRYKVLSSKDGVSRLEVELVTGKTHQIRAHLAHIGHPIVGDGKYGSNAFNRTMKAKVQSLWAYKLKFDFITDSKHLNYLMGREFEVMPEF